MPVSPAYGHVRLLAYVFCLFLTNNCLTCALVHLDTYDTLYQFPGIVYVITIQDGMIRQSIKELEMMVDDKELTQPI
jgi:hypothetical protein